MWNGAVWGIDRISFYRPVCYRSALDTTYEESAEE